MKPHYSLTVITLAITMTVILQGYPVTGLTCTDKFMTGGSMTVFQHNPHMTKMAIATLKLYGNEQHGGFEITQYDTTTRTSEFTDPTTGRAYTISGSDAHHFTLFGKIIDGVATLDHLTNHPSNTYGIVSDAVVVGSYVNGSIHIKVGLSQKYSRAIANNNIMVTIDSKMNLVYFGEVLERSAVNGYLLGEVTHQIHMSGSSYNDTYPSQASRKSVIVGEISAEQSEFIAWQHTLSVSSCTLPVSLHKLPISSHTIRIPPSWYCWVEAKRGILTGSIISVMDDEIRHRPFYSDFDHITGLTSMGMVTINQKSGIYALITPVNLEDNKASDKYHEDEHQN